MEALDRFKQMFRFLWNKFDMYNKDILTFSVHRGAFATYLLVAQKVNVFTFTPSPVCYASQ